MGDQVFGSPPGSAGDIAFLDAIINYDVYGSMGATGYAGQSKVDAHYAAQAGWKSLADGVGTVYVPAVAPGFNDKGVRSGNAPVSRKLTQNDAFGTLFQAMLQGAKTLADPEIGHMILVTSWNEWHEDTQIEPVKVAPPTSVDDSATGNYYTDSLAYEGYGTRYLDILREETFPNLADAILVLKVVCGLDVSGEDDPIGADVNGDGKIGLAKVIFLLQHIAGSRTE